MRLIQHKLQTHTVMLQHLVTDSSLPVQHAAPPLLPPVATNAAWMQPSLPEMARCMLVRN